MTRIPAAEIDLFCDTALDDPYPRYEELRALGPAVWIPQHQLWAITTHEACEHVLRDADTYTSLGAIALNDTANQTMLKGTVLEAGGEEHRRLRLPLSAQLSPRALRGLEDRMHGHARRAADHHLDGGAFDAAALTEEFVAAVVLDLMGLPPEARTPLIEGAAASFDAFGPEGGRTDAALPHAFAMFAFMQTSVTRDAVAPGSWMADLFRAADDGLIEHSDVIPLMAAYTTAGMDTTIEALNTATLQLARQPHLMDALRTSELSGRQLLHEACRYDAPIQGFGRRATRNAEIGQARVQDGQQLWVLYGSAGRDRARWGTDADTFRTGRDGADRHLALGAGPHTCAGNHLAALEADVYFAMLAQRCPHLATAGAAVRRRHNTLRLWHTVPMHAHRPAVRSTAQA